MGQDKALMPWKGSTLIESVAREVYNATGNVTPIGFPERDEGLVFQVVADNREGCGADARVPETSGDLEPLCAGYHARLLSAVGSAIQSKLLKMHDFISLIDARRWPAPDVGLFRNVNTPQQLSETK
jgi:molybdopterin-guanine dinucleotide biosynthesis protein A